MYPHYLIEALHMFGWIVLGLGVIYVAYWIRRN